MKKLKLIFYIVQHFFLFFNSLYKDRKIRRKLRKQNKKAGIKKISDVCK